MGGQAFGRRCSPETTPRREIDDLDDQKTGADRHRRRLRARRSRRLRLLHDHRLGHRDRHGRYQLRRDPAWDRHRESLPGSSSPVSFTVDNPSSGKQRVGTISLERITADAGHSGCSAAISGGNPDFTMPDVVVNKTFEPGNGQPYARSAR